MTNKDSPTKIAGFTSKEFTIGKHAVALGTLYPERPLSLRGKLTIAGKDEKEPVPHGIILHLRFLNRPNGIGQESTVAFVDSSGEFVFSGLFLDSFGFNVQGLPRGFYIDKVTQAGRDVIRSPIRPDGGDLAIIVSADGATIYGDTVDPDGNPVADATIVFSSKEKSGAELSTEIASDQTGRFEMSGLVPGKYAIVCLTGLLAGEGTDPEFIRSQMTSVIEVTAEARQSTAIKLVAHPAHP